MILIYPHDILSKLVVKRNICTLYFFILRGISPVPYFRISMERIITHKFQMESFSTVFCHFINTFSRKNTKKKPALLIFLRILVFMSLLFTSQKIINGLCQCHKLYLWIIPLSHRHLLITTIYNTTHLYSSIRSCNKSQ